MTVRNRTWQPVCWCQVGDDMKNFWLSTVLAMGMLFGAAAPGHAEARQRTYYRNSYRHRARARAIRHRRHVRTAKRVGIGAAGGAAIGALAGGGKAAAIGGLVGAGAGAVYDKNERHHGH